jgi:hypothetical protein
LQNGQSEDSIYDVVQPQVERGCSQWSKNLKVEISGLQGERLKSSAQLEASVCKRLDDFVLSSNALRVLANLFPLANVY